MLFDICVGFDETEVICLLSVWVEKWRNFNNNLSLNRCLPLALFSISADMNTTCVYIVRMRLFWVYSGHCTIEQRFRNSFSCIKKQ